MTHGNNNTRFIKLESYSGSIRNAGTLEGGRRIGPVTGVMAEEEKVVQYFSRDFEWEELRDEVERNPKYSYHLSPFSPSLSSPSSVGADADAWRTFHRRHSTGMFFKVSHCRLCHVLFPVVSLGLRPVNGLAFVLRCLS